MVSASAFESVKFTGSDTGGATVSLVRYFTINQANEAFYHVGVNKLAGVKSPPIRQRGAWMQHGSMQRTGVLFCG